MANEIINGLARQANEDVQKIKKSLIDQWITTLNVKITNIESNFNKLLSYQASYDQWYHTLSSEEKNSNDAYGRRKQFAENNINIIQNFNNANKKNIYQAITQTEDLLAVEILELYELTVTIRQQLTGQKILYHIAIGDSLGYLLEGDFTLDELKSFLKVEGRTKDYGLRLFMTAQQLKDISNKTSNIKEFNYLEQDNSLWLSILDAFPQEIYINGEKKSGINRGNLFQAYRTAILKNSFNINKGLDNNNIQQFKNILQGVIANGGKEGAYTKGGDIQIINRYEQDKIIFEDSLPTFLSTRTVLNQSKAILQSLNAIKNNNGEDINDLINIFTRKNASDEVTNAAIESIIKEVPKLLK